MRLQFLYFNMVSKQHFSSRLNCVTSVLGVQEKKKNVKVGPTSSTYKRDFLVNFVQPLLPERIY